MLPQPMCKKCQDSFDKWLNFRQKGLDISDITQKEFIRKNLDIGYIDFKVYGYTIEQIKQIINFAKSKNFEPEKYLINKE